MHNSFEYLNSNKSGPSFKTKINTNSARLDPQNRLNLKMNSKNKYFFPKNDSSKDLNNNSQFHDKSISKKSNRQASTSQDRSISKNTKLNSIKATHTKKQKSNINSQKYFQVHPESARANQHHASKQKNIYAIPLTKKQKQIREAIEYRHEKSKMRNFKYTYLQQGDSQSSERYIQMMERQQILKFQVYFGHLKNIKTVNLYEYHYDKQTESQKQQRCNKYNDQECINQAIRKSKGTFKKNHQRIKSECAHDGFRHKNIKNSKMDRSNSRKSKNSNQQKIGTRSMDKNFKSIKDIYLNALNSLVSKGTLKNKKNGLYQSSRQLTSQYQSNKSKNKNDCAMNNSSSSIIDQRLPPGNGKTKTYQSNHSTSLKYQNFVNSSRNLQNSDISIDPSHCRKQKLEKTIVRKGGQLSDWKSIVMKVQDGNLNNSKLKKLKIKLNDDSVESELSINRAKAVQSYREKRKSPQFKNEFQIDSEMKIVQSRADGQKFKSKKLIYQNERNRRKNEKQNHFSLSTQKNTNESYFQGFKKNKK